MIAAAPLWAAGPGDLLPVVIVIIIMIVSAAAQWMNKARQPQRPAGGARPPAPGPPQGGAQPAPRPQGQAMNDEIDDFLRRASKRRGAQAAPPPPLPPRPLAEAAAPGAPIGTQVTGHAQQYSDSGEFARRTGELGSEVAQADDLFGEHLHEVFDYEVSPLAEKPGEAAAPPVAEGSPAPEDRLPALPPTAAAGLAALLSDVENIRQAIVINEILRRPEDRWG